MEIIKQMGKNTKKIKEIKSQPFKKEIKWMDFWQE